MSPTQSRRPFGGFIITTKRRHEHETDVGRWDEDEILSRRAVITLEEATDLTWDLMHRTDAAKGSLSVARQRWAGLSAPEGWNRITIGPLPDGTAIDVEPRTADELYDEARMMSRAEGYFIEEIVAAWNEREAERVR